VSVAAGVAALTSAYPSLYGSRVPLCVVVLALLTAVNLYGVAESARILILPTVVFIVAILAVIVVGLVRPHPALEPTHPGAAAGTVGLLLLLRAFASGCAALTGVEAIANAVPTFRTPRVQRAQHTEAALGALLGVMLLGLSVLIGKFHAAPNSTKTLLAQITDASIGHNIGFYVVQFATVVLLALAANTSFGGLPVLASLLARDNNLPHLFALRADRQVYRYGVIVLAVAALALLVGAQGDTQALVPFFAIAVFVGFTIAQFGMIRHWREQRGRGWQLRIAANALGAVLTAVASVIQLVAKFGEGGWLIFIGVAGLVLLFEAINRTYRRIGAGLRLGELPGPPQERRALVVVPVGAVNVLTQEAIGAALSLGDEVRAVTVIHVDDLQNDGAERIQKRWSAWQPQVPLTVVPSETRSLTRPFIEHLRKVEAEDEHDRLVVLIPEMQLPRPWQRLLQNQRGSVLERAIRTYTDAVICRLRFRINVPR
jgi:amino acid transporter